MKLGVGSRVMIIDKNHPHYGESGEISAVATGGPASVGLEWEVKLDSNGIGVEGCFVDSSEIQVI